jgi:hypothetical protein
MKRDIQEELLHATWIATVACCTALHDIGLDAEEIAEEMPYCMKQLGDAIVGRWYGTDNGIKCPMFPGDAIKLGQDKAERVSAARAGVTA